MNNFKYQDFGYAVELADGNETILLQGDDAYAFIQEIEAIEIIWEEGNPNPSIFNYQEDHEDLVIGQYFNN